MRRSIPPKTRASMKRTVIVLCGAAICLTYLSIIIWTSLQRPFTSEDDERFEDGIKTGRRWEWRPPYVLDDSSPAVGDVAMTRERLLSHFRLRLFVPVVLRVPPECTRRAARSVSTSACAPESLPLFSIREHAPVLFSLTEAYYMDRMLPIDVGIVVFAVADDEESDLDASRAMRVVVDHVRAGLRQFLWRHGRVNIQYEDASSSESPLVALLTRSWMPSSDWELGLFLDHHAVVSRYWFQWCQRALLAYLYNAPHDAHTFTVATEKPTPPPVPPPSIESWGASDTAVSDATPRGVVLHPFDAQPLACVVLPQTLTLGATEGQTPKVSKVDMAAAVPSVLGTVWSSRTWMGFLAWCRTRTAPLTDSDAVTKAMHMFMRDSRTAGRCVQGFLRDAQSLYQHPHVPSDVARLLGVWGLTPNITKRDFEQNWCVLPQLAIDPLSPTH